MRPIKFRAWTGKSMMYQGTQYLVSFIRRIVPKIIVDQGILDYKEHESYLPNGGVIDEYLQQYTGLADKNGKEIYEGDVVKDRWGILWKVQWNTEKAHFELAWHGGPQPEYYVVGMYLIKDCHCVIVGNICENPRSG